MGRPVDQLKARWEKRGDKPGMLTVTGEVELPAIYRAVIQPHDPPSEDSDQLVLDLLVTLPSGTPPTGVESRCVLNVAYKVETETVYQTVRLIDVNSEEEGGEEWVFPVRVLTQEYLPPPREGTRWSKMSRPDRV